jgi:hypothetical protein
MSKVDELKSEIKSLPEDDFIELRQWFSEMDWKNWDDQINLDSKSGKLDFLINEANSQKKNDRLKDL